MIYISSIEWKMTVRSIQGMTDMNGNMQLTNVKGFRVSNVTASADILYT